MKNKRTIAKRICAILMAVSVMGTAVNIPWEAKANRMEVPETPHATEGMGKITSVDISEAEVRLTTTTSNNSIVLLLTFLKDGGIRLCAEDSQRQEKDDIFKPTVTTVETISNENHVLVAKGTEGGTKIVLDYTQDKWTLSVCETGSDTAVYKLWADQLTTIYSGNTRTSVSFRGDIKSGEQFIGLGEQYGEPGKNESGFILNGRKVELWNNDSFCQDSYANVPLLHSSKGYSVFFNSYYAARADIGATDEDSFVLDFAGPDLDLYVWTGTPLENVKSYTKLTGTSATIPRWAVGYWAGGTNYDYWRQRGALKSAGDQMATLEKMFQGYSALGTIPSVVYIEGQLSRWQPAYELSAKYGTKVMGWWGPDHPWEGPWEGNEPEKADNQKYTLDYMLKKMETDDIMKLPAVQSINGGFYYEDGNNNGKKETLKVDYTSNWSEELIWRNLGTFWNYGLNGLLVDYGDIIPVETEFKNSLTGDEMHQLQPYYYYKRQQETWKKQFIAGHVKDDYMLFGRAGCAGSQKYAGMAGGDQRSSWNWDYNEKGDLQGGGLKQAINGALSAGTAGFAVWGTDIGGNRFCEDPELYQRWLAFSTFTPLMRTHGAGGVDPWDYGGKSDETQNTFKKYYWLRENISDAVYSAVLKAHADGTPIMQPMALAYPDTLFSVEDQYMFCDEIMVCPISDPNVEERTIILPKGTWYDLLTGEAVYSDGKSRTVSAAVDQIPAYIKSGSIIPMDVSSKTWTLTDPVKEDDGSATQTLLVTPGANGETRDFEWYVSEEEKKTYASGAENGVYTISANQFSNPKVVMAYGMNAEQVVVDGVRLNQLFQQPDGTQAGFYTDEVNKTILVLPSADWTKIEVVSPKTWDYGFHLTTSRQDVKFLDNAFEVYKFGNPASSVAAVDGAHKPSDPDAGSKDPATGDIQPYYTTNLYGTNGRGYLKPGSVENGGYTALTYKNSSFEDFEAEYTMFPPYGVFGLSFGGARGVFPVSLNNNANDDTGVMLFMENDGNLNIGGAIDPATAVCTSQNVTVGPNQWSVLAATNHIVATGFADPISANNGTPTENTPAYTICVKVKNGTLTVWEKTNPDRQVSVKLSEQYQGGYVSMIANTIQHGAFKSFHIRSLDHDMYYPVDFENLSDLTELDDAFTAYHFDKIGNGDKVKIDHLLYDTGFDKKYLDENFNSYYFENAAAAAVKGTPSEQWWFGKEHPNNNADYPNYLGSCKNDGVKPMHAQNSGKVTLLTIKESLGLNFTATVEYNTTFVGYGIMVAPEGELSNGKNGFRVNVNSDGSICIKGAIDPESAECTGADGAVTKGTDTVTGPSQSGYKRPPKQDGESGSDVQANAYYDLTVTVQDGKLTAQVNGFPETLTVNLTKDYAGGSLSLWSDGYNQGGFWKITVDGDKGSESGRPSEYWNRILKPDANQIGTDVPYLKPNHGKGGADETPITFLTYNKAISADFRAKVKIANNFVSNGVCVAPAGQMINEKNGIGIWVDGQGSIHIFGAIDFGSSYATFNNPDGTTTWSTPFYGVGGLWTDFQEDIVKNPEKESDTEKTVYTLCVEHKDGWITAYLEESSDRQVYVKTTKDYKGGSLSLFSTGWNQGGFKSLEFDTFTEDVTTWEKGRQGEYVTFTLRTDLAYGSLSGAAGYNKDDLEYVEAVTPDGVTADVWDTEGSLQLYLNSADAHYGEWVTLVFKPVNENGKASMLSDPAVRAAGVQSAARTTRTQQTFPGDVNNDYDVDVKDLVRLKKFAAGKTTEIHKANSQLNINTRIEESYNQKLLRKKLVK